MNNHGVPRKIHVDQGTNFMSKDVEKFCYADGIEIVQSPVNDHRATSCVEKTIRSLKNSILTYAWNRNNQNRWIKEWREPSEH